MDNKRKQESLTMSIPMEKEMRKKKMRMKEIRIMQLVEVVTLPTGRREILLQTVQVIPLMDQMIRMMTTTTRTMRIAMVRTTMRIAMPVGRTPDADLTTELKKMSM